MKLMLSLFLTVLFLNCGNQDPVTSKVNNQPFKLEGKIAISYDNGNNWKSLDHLITSDTEIFSYFADNEQLLIGSSKASLININLGNAHDKNTENIMEALINTAPIEQNRVFGINSCPSGLYVFVNGSGVFRKTPKSDYWQPLSIPDGIHGVSKIVEDDDSNIFMACQYGLYKSSDFGKNWERVFTKGYVNDVMVHNKTIIVAGIYGIHYSKDSGSTWDQFSQLTEKIGLNKNQNISMFKNDKKLYVFINTQSEIMSNRSEYELIYSDDNGSTWHQHEIEKFLKTKNDIQNVSMYEDKIFVSTKNELLMSTDQGKTWHVILDVPKDQSNKTLRCISGKDRLIVIKENSGC